MLCSSYIHVFVTLNLTRSSKQSLKNFSNYDMSNYKCPCQRRLETSFPFNSLDVHICIIIIKINKDSEQVLSLEFKLFCNNVLQYSRKIGQSRH